MLYATNSPSSGAKSSRRRGGSPRTSVHRKATTLLLLLPSKRITRFELKPCPQPSIDNNSAQCLECKSCRKVSPLVYEEVWLCLQSDCAAFWTLPDGRTPPEELTYAEAFLTASMKCNHDVLEDIAPQPPATQAVDGVVTVIDRKEVR